MKTSIYWLGLTLSVLVLIGCTNSSPKSGQPITTTVDTQFTPAEQASYELALTQIKTGELEKAEKSLAKLSQAHAENPGVWLNLAATYYRNNKMELAGTSLAHAEKINPDIADIHNLAGLIAVERNEYNAAEKSFLAALTLDKSHANAHYNLALVYDIFYQDLSRAITHYEHYLRLIPQEDKDTQSWVEELKLSLKRRNNE